MSELADPSDIGREPSVATEPPRTPSPPPEADTVETKGRTPIKNKASTTILPTLSHSITEQATKDHRYVPKAADEMDIATVQMVAQDFMELIRGQLKDSLTDAQLARVHGFDRLASVKRETEMYPIIVSL